MCAGGQDIPVTLRVAGGVEGGKWKSEEDVRATPPIEEEVETTETTEVTEPVGPSTPLYQPVIDRINKLSEKLPDKVAGETMEAILPRFDHTDNQFQEGIASNNNNLNRIMRHFRIRPQRPRVMDVVNPGGPGKWGGGKGNPHNPQVRPPQTLGTNPQVAGLAGLFGGPKVLKPEQTTPSPLPNFPQQRYHQEMSTPMQPEVMEEQQMEILGQPKQFAGGGIVNALMATPIGQAAIRQYATGGEIGEDVEAEQVLEHTPTGATIEDILAGRATFFGPAKYRHAEVISDISDTLGVAPTRRKREPVIEDQDSEGGDPSQLGPPDYGWASASGPELFGHMPGGKSIDPNTGQPYDAAKDYDPSKVGMKTIPGTFKLGDTLVTGGRTISKGGKHGATIFTPSHGPHKGKFNPLGLISPLGLLWSEGKEQEKRDKRAEQFRKDYKPQIHAAFPPGKAPSFMEPGSGQFDPGLTQPEIDHGAGKGGITTPGAVTLDDTRLGTPDPGQSGYGGTLTPGQAIQKSTAELINYGTKPGASGSIGTSQSITGIDDKSLADAQNPLNDIQHQLEEQGIISHWSKDNPTIPGLQSMSPTKAQSLWSQQFDPRGGYKGTINDPEREDRKIGSTGGIPAQPGLIGLMNMDPNEFDPNLWGQTINPNTPLGALAHAQRSLQAPPLSDAVLADIHKTPMQDVSNQFDKSGYGGSLDVADALGLDYTGTDQPSVDVQTQVDTFSEMADMADFGEDAIP